MTKVGVVAYQVGTGHSVDRYFSFLDSALSTGLDFIIGPEHALSTQFCGDDSSTSLPITERLRALSLRFPKTVIVPGTGLVQVNPGQVQNRAFVYEDGRVIEFNKQSDYGDSDLIAKANSSSQYLRGETRVNTFKVGEKKAWLSICGDSCRKAQTVCHDADFEVVVSHDKNAGAYIGPLTPVNDRMVIVSDSSKPLAQVHTYSQGRIAQVAHKEVYDFNGKDLVSSKDRTGNQRLEVYSL